MHSTVVHHRFSYHSVGGGIVRGDVRCPAEGRGLVTVVICHGFKGFKEWGFFPYLAKQLAESGAYCVSFNFSHNGVGEDLLTFSEPERFRENTPTKECDDLEELLGKLQRRELPESERCGGLTVLMGHSRGGFPVLVCSSEAEGRGLTGIVGVILLASIAQLPQPTAEAEAEWRRAGVQYVVNTRTGERLPMGTALLDDIQRNATRLEECARKLSLPVLLLHGERDEAVPFAHALSLHRWLPHSTLHPMKSADHVFNARHPFLGTTPELEEVVQSSREFLSMVTAR